MDSLDTVRRTQFDIHPDDDPPDDASEYGSVRLYWDPTTDRPPMPSVSVVKGLRVDPEKDDALDGWRNRFDGKSQWARPWYEDQKQFKAYRGTLIHFAILNELGDASGDTYYHTAGDTDYGYEEYHAEYALKKWSKFAPSANTDEIGYSPRANKYDGEHAWDRTMRDMQWATKAFKRQILDSGHLDLSLIFDVETYVYDKEFGYGGQFDLLYEDPDTGETVLGDLKTSSAVRFDHKLQSAAYKHALESDGRHDVDRCEILRLHPGSEEVEISTSDDWSRSLEGLEHEFLGLVDEAHNVVYDNTLREAELELMNERSRTEQSELPMSSTTA